MRRIGSAEQRKGLETGVHVVMLEPRALDGNDHLLGRMGLAINLVIRRAEEIHGQDGA